MYVAAEQTSSGSPILTFLPFILLIVAMYFLFLRPQSRRRREAQQMQASLSAGDEIQTVGGLYGTVAAVDDESVTIEAAPGVRLRYTRGAIARVTKQVEGSETVDTADAAKAIEQG